MKKITIQNVSFNVNDNNLNFWNKVENNKWEKDTFSIFDRFLNEDTVYFDIGAWIGPTVLYAAQLSKSAFAFEPDPVAFNVLKTNLGLNENTPWYKKLTLCNKAVSVEKGFIYIGSKSSGGDSLSSSLFDNNDTKWKVETLTIPELISTNNLKNESLFFKIDIEGGEYELVPALNTIFSTHNSLLFLSFHPGNLFGSIINRNKNLYGKISGWFKVITTHFKILKSLPFRFLYLQSGKKINPFNLLYYTIRLRAFSIVATNQEWD
jgi:FkbM family methyltransferase